MAGVTPQNEHLHDPKTFKISKTAPCMSCRDHLCAYTFIHRSKFKNLAVPSGYSAGRRDGRFCLSTIFDVAPPLASDSLYA